MEGAYRCKFDNKIDGDKFPDTCRFWTTLNMFEHYVNF